VRLRFTRFAFGALVTLFAARAVAENVAPDDATPAAAAVTPPRLLSSSAAVVPEGTHPTEPVTVVLSLGIDAEGQVSEATVVTSGGAEFDQSALTAVKGFRFEPARRGDAPVAVVIGYRYVFPAEIAPIPSVPPAPVPSTESTSAAEPMPAPPSAKAGGEPEEFSGSATIEAPAREVTRRTVSGEMLTEMPGTRGDPVRAIEVMPGVGRTSLNNGDPILRGASPNESQTFLNGAPVPFLYHFGGLTSFFSARYLDRVDLYPGNFSTRYGRVSGGVLDLHTKDPRSDGFHAGLDLSLIDSSAFASSNLGSQGSVGVAARRSNIDLVFSKFVPKNSYSVVAAPLYYDYQAIAAYHLNARNTARVIGYGSRDSVQLFFADPNDEDPSLKGKIGGTIEFHRVQLELESKLGDSTTQTTSATFGRLLASQQIGDLEQVIEGNELHARSEWRSELTTGLSATLGGDLFSWFMKGRYHGPAPGQFEGNPSDNEPNSTRRDISIEDSHLNIVRPGAYLEFGVRPAARVLLVPGVRFDYYGDLRKFSLDPRFTARYEVRPGFTLKSGIGYYTQAPEYYQALSGIGNPNIEPYRALQTSFGFDEQAGHAFKFGAEGFYKRLENRIVGTPDGVAPHFINDGDGRIYGAELSAEYHGHSGTFAYLAYTLSRSERRDGNAGYRLFDHDEPHVLSSAVSQPLGRGWLVGARFRLISGDPSTRVVGSVYDARTGVYLPKYGPINGDRDPTFSQLDVRVEKTWHLGPVSLAAYVDVLNAYDAKNPQGYRYSFDYSQKQPVADLGLFPNLGLKGEL